MALLLLLITKLELCSYSNKVEPSDAVNNKIQSSIDPTHIINACGCMLNVLFKHIFPPQKPSTNNDEHRNSDLER